MARQPLEVAGPCTHQWATSKPHIPQWPGRVKAGAQPPPASPKNRVAFVRLELGFVQRRVTAATGTRSSCVLSYLVCNTTPPSAIPDCSPDVGCGFSGAGTRLSQARQAPSGC